MAPSFMPPFLIRTRAIPLAPPLPQPLAIGLFTTRTGQGC